METVFINIEINLKVQIKQFFFHLWHYINSISNQILLSVIATSPFLLMTLSIEYFVSFSPMVCKLNEFGTTVVISGDSLIISNRTLTSNW